MWYNRSMKKKVIGAILAILIGVGALFPAPAFAASPCKTDNSFFGLKGWYHYLTCDTDKLGKEVVAAENFQKDKLVETIWTIGLTILADLMFVAGLVAVILIIVSGMQFILSAGDAGAAAKARKALTGAIVGLVITLLANVIVNTVLTIFTGDGGF